MKNISKILVIVLILFSATANSQIIFTDVNPDVNVTEFAHGYGVDFNNDATIDVHVALLSNIGVWAIRLIPEDSEDVNFVINTGGNNGGATVVNYGENISSASNWYKVGSGWGDLLYGHWDSNGNYGYWTGIQNEKYLGLKFKVGNDYFLGWINISTEITANDDMEFTIHSFAYNSVPNEAILAGDEGSGVDISEINSKFSVYPNPAKNILKISNLEDISVFDMQITDISGKIIQKTLNTNKTEIDISTLPEGVYFLHINTENKVLITKFIKQ